MRTHRVSRASVTQYAMHAVPVTCCALELPQGCVMQQPCPEQTASDCHCRKRNIERACSTPKRKFLPTTTACTCSSCTSNSTNASGSMFLTAANGRARCIGATPPHVGDHAARMRPRSQSAVSGCRGAKFKTSAMPQKLSRHG